MTYVIDLETAPLSEEEQEPFAPEFASAKNPGLSPDQMPQFKNGTLKDPEKIAAWEAQKQSDWLIEQADLLSAHVADIQAKRAAWLDGAQLDATRCRICAAGSLVIGSDAIDLRIDMHEREVIETIWSIIATGHYVAAHNIGYDLGMLEQRSAILGIRHEPIRDKNRNYYRPQFLDTKALWKPNASSVNTPANLDTIGKAFGMGSKPGNGKDFWTYAEGKQREYLTHDLRVTAEIVKRCGEGLA